MIIGDSKYNNLYFEEKFIVTDVFSKLFVSNDVGKTRTLYLTGCSKVIYNIPAFRLFNDLICLKEHCSNMHKNDKGFGYIPLGSIVNLKYDKDIYKIGTIEQGSVKRHYLVNKEIVGKYNWEAGGKHQNKEKLINELKITVWNMIKAVADDNITFINKFLIEENTDILMINETGKLNYKKLNKDYKIYGKDKYVTSK